MFQTPFSGAVKRMLGKINAKAAAYPVAFSIAVTSAKAASADLMIQTCVERTKWEEVDWNRNRVFGAFGACYQGCFQYFVYSKLFERLLPGQGIRNVLVKVVLSNVIVDPCFFFPCFYSMKEAMRSGEICLGTVTAALQQYKVNYWNDWLNSWMVWIPGYTISYAFVPPHLRMASIAGISFGYVALLSYTRGAFKEEAKVEMRRLDLNQDGLVSRKEFVAAGGTSEEFEKADINKDQMLDLEELRVREARRSVGPVRAIR